MIGTRYQVKLIAKGFDGISAIQPDADFDTTAGFSVGYVLLVEDGTTWRCDDATVGAAVWTQDTSNDASIDEALRTLTDILPRHLNNSFINADDRVTISGADFTAGTIASPGAAFDESIMVGDTIYMAGSRRNDGPYDVTAVTPDELEVTPVTPRLYLDNQTIYIVPGVFPTGLIVIASRMAWYDVYVRPGQTPGMTGESVGSYSYTRMELVGGIEYPADLTAGLSVYKRPRVI